MSTITPQSAAEGTPAAHPARATVMVTRTVAFPCAAMAPDTIVLSTRPKTPPTAVGTVFGKLYLAREAKLAGDTSGQFVAATLREALGLARTATDYRQVAQATRDLLPQDGEGVRDRLLKDALLAANHQYTTTREHLGLAEFAGYVMDRSVYRNRDEVVGMIIAAARAKAETGPDRMQVGMVADRLLSPHRPRPTTLD